MKRTIILLFLLLLVAPASAALTNYTASTATASGYTTTYTPAKAIDNNIGTAWIHLSQTTGYIQFDYGAGTSHIIKEYKIDAYRSWAGNFMPVAFKFEGSNNGASWTVLDTQTSQSAVQDEIKTYNSFTNTNAYRYYKLNITTAGASGPGAMEIQLWGDDTAEDTTPPSSITNLANSTTCENVTFTWNNPLDTDYSHLYNLWDNAVQANLTNSTTTKAFTPAAGTHTFSTKTVDLTGNMNTTWVNQSVLITACPTPTPTPTPSVTITPSPPLAGAQWCGLQDIWYQHQDSSDIVGYEEWQNYPSGNAEVDENVTVTASDGWKLIDSYITPPGLPNVNVVQPGLRTYHLFGYVDSTAGITKLNTTLFKRNTSGGETFIYAVETDSIESTTVQDNVISFASSSNLTLDATDRFVSKIYASTNSAANIRVHFVYQGTSHASYVRSGYFVCPDVCCVPTPTPTATSPPFVLNPSTDKKTDWWKSVKEWWWLPLVIIGVVWLVSKRD